MELKSRSTEEIVKDMVADDHLELYIKPPRKGKQFKVLLVDDDIFISELYVTKFILGGHQIVPALTGQEALKILREKNDFDAICTDLVMPEMDGLTFVEMAQKEGLFGDSVFIVFSNQNDYGVVEAFQKLGAKEHIVKANMMPNEVLELVECTIDKYKYGGKYGYCEGVPGGE